ncbi:zinc ribbon domain-containing protein [Lactobacillus acidophilus]|uniref:zinc ribbon domain-containing protein n=1 Tax=Lactobacillus acidophilus TaxID=1579 RepID=UPI00096AC86D|nr:zinc ribbon domain-containing protein [Lactobacillus acidophilus]
MTTCPNCGHKISDTDDICPNCGFNLKKYRDDFFTDKHQKAKYEEPDEVEKIASRAAYREEFSPEKQNSTVQRMIAWVRKNATIVFLLGVFLLILMSFSRAVGWICFLILMVWLFIVCDRKEKIEQYTADKRLTQKLNQVGSNIFNRVDEHEDKVKTRGREFVQKHPRVETQVREIRRQRQHRYSYIQLSVILTALISLIVLFTDSGAAVSAVSYTQKMSISNVIFSLAGRLLSSGMNSFEALVLYIVWLLLFLFPIFIIYNILKNTKSSQVLAFILSLLETVFLIYIVYKMSSTMRASTGVLAQITSQLITYAVSIGASSYFLMLASILTTGLSGFNIFKHKQNQNN